MAYEAITAIAGYIGDALFGSATAEAGAGAAAEVGSAAAGAAGASTAAEAAGTSSVVAAGSATSYATYASMAAQAVGGAAAVSSSLNQAASATYNAKMGVSNAQQASMQAGAAEETQRRNAAAVLGNQRAAFAQSGVDPSSGTGLLAQEQSATNAEMDALNVRYQGLVQGRGLLAQSALDTRQASIYSQNAMIAGINTPLSTFGAYQGGQGAYLRQRNIAGTGYGQGGY